jgi:hypothetical protein
MEVVTLQIGHYANFVGTHFWNAQQEHFLDNEASQKDTELNHHVLFRLGQDFWGKETFTPRLLCVDLKGSLKTLSSTHNRLYHEASSPSIDRTGKTVWSGEVQTYKQEVYERNAFLSDLEREEQEPFGYHQPVEGRTSGSQSISDPKGRNQSKSYDLDEAIEVWSDYLGVYYHPKSIMEIPHFFHGNSETPFDFYYQGYGLCSDTSFVSRRRRLNFTEAEIVYRGSTF